MNKLNEKSVDYLNPIPFLESLKGKIIKVKLKWGLEYEGILLNFDHYFNIQVNLIDITWVSI